MSEVEAFLADIPKEDSDPFENKADAPATDSPSETKQTDDTVKTEETPAPDSSPEEKKEDVNPLPFHKDPAIQDYLNRQIETRTAKVREEIEQSISSKFSPKEETNIPGWFSRIYGDDKDAWRDYQNYESTQKQSWKQELVREQESKTRAEQERVSKANQYIDDSLETLKSQGKKFEKNELLKVVSDYRPVNESGNWDFEKAYDILELKKARSTEKSDARKKLADATSSDTKAEPTPKNVYTYDELRKKGWHSY